MGIAFPHPMTGGFPLLRNYTPAAMAKWRLALAKQRAGQAHARIALVGDSTKLGYLGAPSPNGYVGARPYGIAASMTAQLNKMGETATSDMFINDGNVTINSNTLPQYDTRVTLASGWASGSGYGYGGNNLANTTTTNNLSFAPGISFDTIDVFYVANQTGTFNLNIDGGADLGADINVNAGATYKKATYTVTAGKHTVNLYRKTGSIYIVGVDCYLNSQKSIKLIPIAAAGYRAGDFSVGSYADYAAGYWISNLHAPDLTFLDLTINDWKLGTSLSTFQTNLQTAITQCLGTGSLILMSGVPSANSATAVTTQAAYINIAWNLAQANNVPFLSLTDEWSSYEFGNPLGFYADTLHPSLGGYNNIAGMLATIATARV